jgi:hypothetical protein
MHGQHRLLFDRLDGHEPQVWARDGCADRFGIIPIILRFRLEHILGDIETNSGHLHCLLPLLSVSDVFSVL